MVSVLVDFLFILYPGGSDSSLADLVELLFSLSVMVSDKLRGLVTLDPDGVLLEFYMVLNFVTRYTFGSRRIDGATKSRGPSFLQRYRETLPRSLKKPITNFFRLLVKNLDDNGGPKSKTLQTVLESVSLLGKNFDINYDNGLGSILNLPETFNPLYFTRMWSKKSGKQFYYVYKHF